LWIHALLLVGEKQRARAEIDSLLKDGLPSASRVDILDGIACISIYYGHMEMLEDSLRYIEEAIIAEPDAITLKGTKGSILVESGRIDDGIAMLEEVRNTSISPIDHAISEYYLALGHYRMGRHQDATKHLDAGISIAPQCIVRWKIEEEIRSSKEAGSTAST
jgi:tetratricopeptide (TPR) repeat protein